MAVMANYKGLHVDVVLSNFAEGYSNKRFVAGLICPDVAVPNSSGIYNIWAKENFRHVETARRDGADFFQVDMEWTTGTFTTKSYGLGATVTKKQEANADTPYQPRRRKVKFCKDLLMLDREIRVKTLAEASTSFATGHSTDLGAGAGWNEYDSPDSDPEQDIMTACETIYDATFNEPDSIIIPYKYARQLAKHPQIRALREVKDDKLLTTSGLPGVLFGLKVIQPGAGYVSTAKGQTITLSSLWSDNAIVFYNGAPASEEDASWLASFMWGRQEVEINYDFTKKSNLITVEEPERDEKLVSNYLAYKIADIEQ